MSFIESYNQSIKAVDRISSRGRIAALWDHCLILCRPMAVDTERLREFAGRYAAAWCSQDPASVAAFFSRAGSLKVNDDTPAVGREAIAAVALSFMTAFPDMRVTMDKLLVTDDRAEFHWTLTGTNSGAGGTGHGVRISGFEQWQIGADGLIASSLGHFDKAEYQRQLQHGVETA
jgi:predicted ester cyclase